MATAQKKFASDETCRYCASALAFESSFRGSTKVVCVACKQPVLPDHPLQLQVDREWREKKVRDEAAAQHAREHPPVRTEYEMAHPYAEMDRRLAALERSGVALRQENAELRQQLALVVAELKKRGR